MTTLLTNLGTEVHSFSDSSTKCLSGILAESQNCLNELRLLEAELEAEAAEEEQTTNDIEENLTKVTNTWYARSITQLKGYNSGVNKFLKNILNNPQYRMELDEAYTYPLNLSNYPVVSQADESKLGQIQRENHEELLKAIILHLLKIGQCNLVNELVKEIPTDNHIVIDQSLLNRFNLLNEIVEDITRKHDISKALNWFKEKRQLVIVSTELPLDTIEFKFHMLQFTLLLSGSDAVEGIDNSALSAYMYSKENFSSSMKSHLEEVSALMTLLVLRRSNGDTNIDLPTIEKFSSKLLASLRDRDKVGRSSSISFASEILLASNNIHENEAIFTNLSNEFISEYCKDLNLSNDSSLFQCILSGFVNLPSFYKYNKIQLKLGRGTKTTTFTNTATILPTINSDTMVDHVATFRNDLPFQLLGASSFLFLYHPIFICPVSKEQLIPLTEDDRDIRVMHDPNPVVVLKFCHHLALRESVWQLSKRGKDYFKCHYCYKRHKFSDVKEAYFIDL